MRDTTAIPPDDDAAENCPSLSEAFGATDINHSGKDCLESVENDPRQSSCSSADHSVRLLIPSGISAPLRRCEPFHTYS